MSNTRSVSYTHLVTQFSFASIQGSFPSKNVSGKKYGKNLPSVYLTPGISAIILSVAPPPTDPTTPSNPIPVSYTHL